MGVGLFPDEEPDFFCLDRPKSTKQPNGFRWAESRHRLVCLLTCFLRLHFPFVLSEACRYPSLQSNVLSRILLSLCVIDESKE